MSAVHIAQAAGPAPLAGLELGDLIAFAEVLLEGRTFSARERAALVDYIEERARDGSGYYTGLYRTTVGLLNRLAGGRFSRLDVAKRAALLMRYHLVSSDVRPGEPLGPLPEQARAVRTQTIPDLIGGYYRSAAGWAVVEYNTFPGRCGDLARYTGPEP